MRVSKAVMASNNRKIIDNAAALFRQQGIDATSVAQVMEAAGLTHGGFYRHFESKEALVVAALDSAFERLMAPLAEDIETLGGQAALRRFAEGYLSKGHALNRGQGCPLAALAAEADRNQPSQKAALARGRQRFIAVLAQALDNTVADKVAVATGLLSVLVGALVMARACEDEAAMAMALESGKGVFLGLVSGP